MNDELAICKTKSSALSLAIKQVAMWANQNGYPDKLEVNEYSDGSIWIQLNKSGPMCSPDDIRIQEYKGPKYDLHRIVSDRNHNITSQVIECSGDVRSDMIARLKLCIGSIFTEHDGAVDISHHYDTECYTLDGEVWSIAFEDGSYTEFILVDNLGDE